MNGQITGHAILENVRRYRGIASLYRQTAAFRPGQSWSLLEQARDWEARALLELEAYFAARMDHAVPRAQGPIVGSCTDTTGRLRSYLELRMC
ncbi:hypothetical protein [Bradyrhizobium sp. 149]|uniref:hypothetical protein n=1 Tax=Bradyrhizobium sp. 149 TaxID=2782624 RepID=UPI001FF6FF78|nr:hypothetical protein [Bradyrhizobium sp. 149]